MNWDRVSGNWKQMKGKIKEQWGRLTDDEIEQTPATASSSKARSRSVTASRRTR
jgi:uncharacterized protein YjbJ (UPF0337 family)